MRSGDDGGAELDGFHRVLAAMGHERAADKGHRHKTIKETELADGVGDVDVGARVRQLAFGAKRDFEVRCGKQPRDEWASIRMARHDDGEEVGPPPLHGEMSDGGDVVLSRMRARDKPYRASGKRGGERLMPGQVHRRRWSICLEIANGDGAWRAKRR